jgi:hypothetical protein
MEASSSVNGENLMDLNKHVSMVADFSTLALLLIPVGIAINVVGGSIAKALHYHSSWMPSAL